MKKLFLIIFIFLFSIPYVFSQNWEELNEKTVGYYKSRDYNNAEIYGLKSLKQCEKEFGKISNNYAVSLTNLALIYQRIEKFDDAEEKFKEAISIRKEIFGEINFQYAITLKNISDMYRDIAKFKEAEIYLIKYLEIISQLKGEQSIEYAEGLDGLAHCRTKTGDFDESEKLLLKSLKIKKEINKGSDISYSITLNDLGVLYAQIGKYEEAERYMKEALEIDKVNYGEKSPDYATDLNNLALLYYDMGRFDKAERLLNEAKDIRKNILGEKNPSYVSTLNDLGLLNDEMGRYEEAEKLYKEALEITKEVLGTKNEYYAQYLNSLATLYSRTQRQKEAEKLFNESLSIIKTLYGENSPYYSFTLNNIAWLYKSIGELSKSEEIYLRLNKIIKELYGIKHSFYATNLGNLALLYIKMGNNKKAEKLLLESIKIRKEVLGEKHPDYINAIGNLAELYTSLDRLDEAEPLYKKTNENLLNYIYIFYPYLSEKEKMQYLKLVDRKFEQFKSFVLKRYKQNPMIANDFFNLSIATKGIILSSTTKIRSRILNSGDELLIADYKNYINLKLKLNKAYSSSASERQKDSIDIGLIENQVNECEKNLSFRSEIFSSEIEKREITFKDFEKKIDENEAVIDFVNFQHINEKGNINNIYGALVLRKNYKYPVLIELCTEDDLKNIITIPPEYRKSYINDINKSLTLYDLIWKPLESHLKNVSKIYLSSSGLLHLVSLNALSDSVGKYIFDKYKLYNYGNLKDLISNKTEENIVEQSLSATVFGGAIFDYDSIQISAITERHSNFECEDWIPPSDNKIINRNFTAQKWTYLKGTLSEAQLIDSLFKSRGLKSSLKIERDASESELKKLNYLNSPDILHIATHGYFYPAPTADMYSFSRMNKFQLSENPLIRSGLIFSGANRVWMGEGEIENAENGILTALDISNLDLINTKLVVLSACETGLGDIEGGEGVFGLQRAFKVAGAKTIIMSLWKVPDKETVELMELFYKNWLDGMTKHEALHNAQNEMRRKYPPYYWAAFVMVE